MNATFPTFYPWNSTMQKRLVLEEAKMSPYFLLGVISGTFGIVAYGTLEFGSGCEIEVDIYLFLVGIEIYLRECPWILYIQCSSEKVFVHLIFISFCDDSIVGVGVLKYPYKTEKSHIIMMWPSFIMPTN
jgi:hypothetical protein